MAEPGLQGHPWTAGFRGCEGPIPHPHGAPSLCPLTCPPAGTRPLSLLRPEGLLAPSPCGRLVATRTCSPSMSEMKEHCGRTMLTHRGRGRCHRQSPWGPGRDGVEGDGCLCLRGPGPHGGTSEDRPRREPACRREKAVPGGTCAGAQGQVTWTEHPPCPSSVSFRVWLQGDPREGPAVKGTETVPRLPRSPSAVRPRQSPSPRRASVFPSEK